jgi:hypothetical protein
VGILLEDSIGEEQQVGTYVKLIKLKCEKQNEPHGDEPYLTWKGNKIWGWTPDNEGKCGKEWDLTEELDLLSVDKKGGLIKLMEYDPDTADDTLGNHTIWASEVGQGEKTVTLEGDDAVYHLTYKVISV